MKIFKNITFLIISAIILSLFAPLSAGAVSYPDIKAKAALLVELNTKEIFYSKKANDVLYPASLTKIMTVLLAVEAIERGDVSFTDMVTASSMSHNDLTPDSSTQNIIPGETMSLEGLLYCAMLASANEACNIIGEYISGSISDFLDLMKTRADELGCTNTNFENTHGLPNDNHYSTAWDIYLIASEAMRHPLFANICGTYSIEIAQTNKSDVRYLTNTNRLISSDRNSSYYYAYADGVKTGSTEAAGYCLVSTAHKGGISLLSVVLGAEAVQQDDGSFQIQSFSETKRLFEWAFDSYSFKEILSTTELVTEAPVLLGRDSDSVLLKPQSPITVLLPNDITPADFTREIVIFSNRDGESIEAPVTQGQILGEITLSKDGKVYGKVNLLANSGVERSKIEYMKQQIKDTLNTSWVKWTIAILIFLIILYIIFVIAYNKARRRRRENVFPNYTGRNKRR